MATSYPNHDIGATCTSAARAFDVLQGGSPPKAARPFSNSIAAALDAQRDEVLNTCADETALTIDELTPEFARMTGTLRMFAALVREGSWVRAAIDTPSATARSGPRSRHSVAAGSARARRGVRLVELSSGVWGLRRRHGQCAGGGVPGDREGTSGASENRTTAGKHRERSAPRPALRRGGGGVGSPRDFRPVPLTLCLSRRRSFGLLRRTADCAEPACPCRWLHRFDNRRHRGSTSLAGQRPGPIRVFAEMGSLNAVFIWPKAVCGPGGATICRQHRPVHPGSRGSAMHQARSRLRSWTQGAGTLDVLHA